MGNALGCLNRDESFERFIVVIIEKLEGREVF